MHCQLRQFFSLRFIFLVVFCLALGLSPRSNASPVNEQKSTKNPASLTTPTEKKTERKPQKKFKTNNSGIILQKAKNTNKKPSPKVATDQRKSNQKTKKATISSDLNAKSAKNTTNQKGALNQAATISSENTVKKSSTIKSPDKSTKPSDSQKKSDGNMDKQFDHDAESDHSSHTSSPALYVVLIFVLGCCAGYFYVRKKSPVPASPKSGNKDSNSKPIKSTPLQHDSNDENSSIQNRNIAQNTNKIYSSLSPNETPLTINEHNKHNVTSVENVIALNKKDSSALNELDQHQPTKAHPILQGNQTSITNVEPCDFERYIEIREAKNSWDKQNKNIADELYLHFQITLSEWANISDFWTKQITSHPKYAAQDRTLTALYRSKYNYESAS